MIEMAKKISAAVIDEFSRETENFQPWDKPSSPKQFNELGVPPFPVNVPHCQWRGVPHPHPTPTHKKYVSQNYWNKTSLIIADKPLSLQAHKLN